MLDGLRSLEKKLQHCFHDKTRLLTALTHPSFSHENGSCAHYQRLEFLGDRILGLVVAEMLYHRFPEDKESILSIKQVHLVKKETLMRVAKLLSLEEYVRVAPQNIDLLYDIGSKGIMADVIEAIIAALYLDAGIEKVTALVQRWWHDELQILFTLEKDPKTRLQEFAQKECGSLPKYRVLKSSMDPNIPSFVVEVSIDGKHVSVAQGTSKRKAQKAAAERCLQSIGVALLDMRDKNPPNRGGNEGLS